MSNLPKEFYIPEKSEIIFVQDYFIEDIIGGAELTSDAIINACPKKLFKLHSHSFSESLFKKHKNKLWMFANIMGIDLAALYNAVRQGMNYVCLEYDYKWCGYRSKQLHIIKESKECDCSQNPHGKFYSYYYAHAQKIAFMSHRQLEDCVVSCGEQIREKCFVQSSVWSKEDLEYVCSLRQTPKSDKYAILTGATWIKNQRQTEEYCKQNNLPYNLIGKLPYKEFIKELSSHKGLVFMPAGDDTCPRITVEAKLMGLELVMNNHVLHKDESWFNKDNKDIEQYLHDGPSRFWNSILKS
jgi:hypothetical protein